MFDLNQLPGNPRAFFELEVDSDRRGLKRAYGKAIRQFNPETHPSEFQRVREAYERLDKQLRYGKERQALADAADAWRPDTTATTDKTVEDAAVKQPRRSRPRTDHYAVSAADSKPLPPTLKELAVLDSGAALEQLQSKLNRRPQDYFFTAVLHDAVAGKQTTKYLVELIEGLVVFPTDPGLTVLASEYLRTEVPDAMLTKIVQFVSGKIREPLFYMLTEPLWVRLVVLLPFAQFEALLKSCEQQIRQNDPATKTAFYLRLLLAGIWTAPALWCQRVLQEIEKDSANLDYSAAADLEFLSDLQQIKIQTHSVKLNPIRKQLIQALRLLCRPDESSSIAQVIQILSSIARNAAAMQEAFPLDDSEKDDVWVSLVYKMIGQLSGYLDESEEIAGERIAAQTSNLISDLAVTEARLISPIANARWMYHWLPLIGVFIVGILSSGLLIVLPTRAISNGSGWFSTLGFFALIAFPLVVFYRWGYPKLLEPRMKASQRAGVIRQYSTHWRSRLFRFAASSNEPMEVHSARIEFLCQQNNISSLTTLVQQCVFMDRGLRIFAALQAVLK